MGALRRDPFEHCPSHTIKSSGPSLPSRCSLYHCHSLSRPFSFTFLLFSSAFFHSCRPVSYYSLPFSGPYYGIYNLQYPSDPFSILLFASASFHSLLRLAFHNIILPSHELLEGMERKSLLRGWIEAFWLLWQLFIEHSNQMCCFWA